MKQLVISSFWRVRKAEEVTATYMQLAASPFLLEVLSNGDVLPSQRGFPHWICRGWRCRRLACVGGGCCIHRSEWGTRCHREASAPALPARGLKPQRQVVVAHGCSSRSGLQPTTMPAREGKRLQAGKRAPGGGSAPENGSAEDTPDHQAIRSEVTAPAAPSPPA